MVLHDTKHEIEELWSVREGTRECMHVYQTVFLVRNQTVEYTQYRRDAFHRILCGLQYRLLTIFLFAVVLHFMW